MQQSKKGGQTLYSRFFKRFLDLLLSGCALVVLSPVLLVVAILVKIKLGSPVIFCQERPGKGEKIFRMYKFRSMTDERDEAGNLLPDEVRMTKFGRLLRSTSLDELPELWNIFRGDMSIIGPRPLLPSYLPYYTEEERHRHDVRPGLSGLAQVKGRSFLSWEEIFALDVAYVRDITFWNDCKIILNTAKKVLCHADIADVSAILKDEQGRSYVLVDGEKRYVHQSLTQERAGAESSSFESVW